MLKRKQPEAQVDTDAFARDGFLVIDGFLTQAQLQALRVECDDLYAATTPEAIVELGCVLDPFATAHMTRSARTQRDAYMTMRRKQTRKTSEGNCIEALLFQDLPQALAPLFSPSEGDIYFFNEHYVVKPPETNVEFRWHQDDAEQLGMCVHRSSIPWYLSAWVALDDITATNGALRFLPWTHHPDGVEDPADLDLSAATAPLAVAAGAAVVFRSDIWHFSAVNATSTARRAFYAQYTPQPIYSSPRTIDPLCSAIPIDRKPRKSAPRFK
ncbi:hypothetical protein SPRG_13219 [Saprolegnia parasitica CBS 223.65]|uniref:Phytanoyl-CoA dioxygenase n=1 Tax=Saprolegnia parasitica (strain CBS 223.65) TaxID=695850 RepID=A0A067BSU6_SAPPC|nr:hypothetical protein SPRG_13219 [Saprolegnia parasitica CBS 223.65]KDO21328.1 hypothetical protein SPRG_13219 [Saprolegnia parasitica CBS 223.65]|eukprot:XP_012207983.1 hypothetical protein SPRG_13219 [Saprolegnia parasitica CBS 223.65]